MPIITMEISDLEKELRERALRFLTTLDEPVAKFIKDMEVIEADIKVSDTAKIMKEKGITGVIVMEDGIATGVLTERDILYKVVAEGLPATNTKVRQVMSSPVITISPETTIREALEIMTDRHIRRLVVVRDKKPLGVIVQRIVVGDALEDVALLHELDKKG